MLTNCRTLTELYSQQREGELSAWQRFKVRLHLTVCGPCRAYACQMETTIQAVKTLREEPPSDVNKALLETFRNAVRKP